MSIRNVARALSLAVGIHLCFASADAQTPPTSAHLTAAHELLAVMQVDRAMLGAFEATIDAQLAQTPAMQGMRGVMVSWAAKYLTMEYMGEQLATAYAEEFTESELNELAAFYRTPLGVKLAERTPELTRKGAIVGSEIAAKYSGELQRMIQEHMQQPGTTALPQP